MKTSVLKIGDVNNNQQNHPSRRFELKRQTKQTKQKNPQKVTTLFFVYLSFFSVFTQKTNNRSAKQP
eukprot:m.67446 g.67446  ORF g.67446 m.67446 type:complete len:67 (+) comp23813_c0_seq2:2469-2669(+)